MAIMNRRHWTFLGTMAVGGALLVASCGGGSTDNNAGKGQRITDPAKVPSSTPIGDTLTYQIRNDVIIAPGLTPGSVASGGTPASGSSSYTVKSGDTCSSIAAQHGITSAALMSANRTIDGNCSNLRPGDVLKIPGGGTSGTGTSPAGASTSPTAKPGGKTYKVQSGDTCDAIAKAYGVDVNKLIALNGLDASCKNLQPGQVVSIP